MIDERELKEQLLENTNKDFLSWVKAYDESLVPIMKQKGYCSVTIDVRLLEVKKKIP